MQRTERSNPEGWSKDRIQAFFESGPDPARWARRRWEIMKAIDRHASALEAVSTLFGLLGHELEEDHPTVADWREKISEGRELAAFVDGFLSGLDDVSGLLDDRRLAARLCTAWLLLEVRFQPDERCCLADLRDRLVREADRREMDLRGLGI